MASETTTLTITKTFRWDMAHRLPFHTEGCQNIHGHTYTMDIAVTGVPDRNGMLLDFGALKSLVMPFISQMDHAFVCWREDTLMKSFLESTSFKVHYVDFQTTSENLAIYFLSRLKEALRPYANLSHLRIVIHETPSSHAAVECILGENTGA